MPPKPPSPLRPLTPSQRPDACVKYYPDLAHLYMLASDTYTHTHTSVRTHTHTHKREKRTQACVHPHTHTHIHCALIAAVPLGGIAGTWWGVPGARAVEAGGGSSSGSGNDGSGACGSSRKAAVIAEASVPLLGVVVVGAEPHVGGLRVTRAASRQLTIKCICPRTSVLLRIHNSAKK